MGSRWTVGVNLLDDAVKGNLTVGRFGQSLGMTEGRENDSANHYR